jgi:hypothetical protein
MCNYKIQTVAGMMPCDIGIEHTHLGPAAEPLTVMPQQVDLSEVWKEIERLKDIIKRLDVKVTTIVNTKDTNIIGGTLQKLSGDSKSCQSEP